MADKVDGQKLPANAAEILAKFTSDQDMVNEAAELTESLVRYINSYAKQNGLNPEQVVFGVALTTINMRQTAPKGKEWFDECAASAWDYYSKNVK